jgi:hypothetical protein
MARIKKYAENLTQNLTTFQTFVNDVNSNSEYFRITEFKDTFTGGKNGFLIEGSEHLKESTEIRIQLLDVQGNSIYYEPGNGIPEYYEGISKLVAVHIYEDTPIGLGKITILGELKTYVDENGTTRDIPDNWKDVYNVKWERTFQVNKNLSNEDAVRFYRRPEVSITEIVKPIFSNIVTSVTQTGNAYGIAQVPVIDTKLGGFSLPTSYLIQTDGNSFWTGSMDGNTITFTDLGFSATFDDIINDTDATIATPYTVNGLVKNFEDEPYTITFNHLEGLDNLKTALTGSFAKINLTDLTTFVGDVARVKVFRKSQSDLADYQFIQEIQLESNEILTDLESTVKNLEYYGIFEETSYNDYWLTSSNDLSVEYNNTFLYGSLKLDSSGVNDLFTTKSIDVQQDVEYTLQFNTRLAANLSSDNYLAVFISGSRQSTLNGSPVTIQVEQPIVTITSDNSILQKSNLNANFKAEQLDDARLYFRVKGDGWYLSDVSLRASQETSFSPDEITFIQPIPRTLPAETFDFLFQFYDINNNYIPVVVEESKTFDGGNLNVINKRLELIPSANYFQFDSGSGNGNPVPPTVIFIDVVKEYLTGSVTFTSRSFDFFNNELSSSQYSYTPTPGYTNWQFPGLLTDINTDQPYLTVQNFTGSRDPGLEEIVVQFIEYTGECEGVSDSIVITRVVDGKGGVNYELRPYNGIFIRNSDPSSSLEVQAIRIDGVNEINLRSNLPAGQSSPQIHVQSGSTYITLEDADTKGFIRALEPGLTGSGELNYNAIFNRDSIDGQLKLFLIPSGSSNPSASILTTITLTDLQDGLDAGVVLFDSETFTINPRVQTQFTPTFTSATASFYRRGTFEAPISCSFEIYPSMSINQDWTPEYFMYFVTHSCNPDISVVVYDEVGNIIPSRQIGDYVYSSSEQTKQLLTSFTYTEPWTTASVNVDKLFTIVPEGKPGDESIVFEVVPSTINLKANSRGVVDDFASSITDIRLKQGSRYLAFSSSAAEDPFYSHGQFHIATSSILFQNVTPGNVHFTSSNGVEYTASLIVSQSSNLTDLSGSITYPLIIHPYYTSSIYTASVVVNYNKILDGPPPIEFIVNDFAVTLQADEVEYVSDYANANTQIQVKEGSDYLTFTTQSEAPGTWRINSITPTNIQLKELSSSSFETATIEYERFDYPFLSASALYSFTVYPYSLGPGHQYTSSVYERTQTFVKSVAPAAARNVTLTSTSETVNFDGDGLVVSPAGDIRLDAEVFNFTGSVWYQFLRDGIAYSPIQSENFFEISSGDSTSPGEIATWRVDVRDGSNTAGTPTSAHPIKAQAQITISGIKAGAEVYSVTLTNENSSVVGDIWEYDTTGTGTQIIATKADTQLTHVSSFSTPTQDFLGNDIGSLGEYRVTIFSKSAHITLPGGLTAGSVVPTVSDVATIGDIATWSEWGNNTSAEIVYQIDIENGRQTLYKTQSLAIQFSPDGPYSTTLSNENSSVVYRVSGELETAGTGNIIRAFRGETELTHTGTFTSPQTDAFGDTGYKDQYQVTVYFHSAHLDLEGSTTAGSVLTTDSGLATIGDIDGWGTPETYPTALVVYRVELEGREFLYKTQSLSVQFEGNTGPGIVMRGVWENGIDYIGSVETTNYRRDAVIWPDPATYGETHFWASVSGSGPNTNDANAVLVGPQQPDDAVSPNFDDTSYWQYLGEQEFFVAAKIAIFEESFVKNTINVGTKDGTGAFANIVISGGRPDPYIAVGQTGTQGTAGTSGTSNPATGIIGYDRPGIFLGVYEDGSNGTTGRFSIKSAGGSGTRGMFWDGSTLTIRGAIRQLPDGASEGRMLGPWADLPVGFDFFLNDVVSNGGDTYTVILNHLKGVGGDEPGVGGSYTTYWEIAPIAAPSLRLTSDYQSFVVAKDGTVTPSTITFTSIQQNLIGSPVFTSSPSVTLGGSGTTRTLSSANFGANTAVAVTSTIGSLSDTITIVKLEEGSDGLTVVLTNESHTLQTTNAGSVNYVGSGTDIYVYEGSTALLYDGAGLLPSRWTVSAAGTDITPSSPSDQGVFARYGDHSSMTQNQASITYTITGKRANGDSFTLTKLQSFAKSIQGANGTNGAPGVAGPPGAGVVYRGVYDSGETYYYTTERRDIVKGTSGTYFLANNALDSGTTNWDDPDSGTDWTTFGAQFSSVATDILFSQDVYAERTINIGANGATPVIALNADHPTNANPFISIGQTVQGYNNDGIFLGYDGGVGKLSVDNGSIGGWNISSDNINATDGTGTTYLYSDGRLSLLDSGDVERLLVTQGNLSSTEFTPLYTECVFTGNFGSSTSTAFNASGYAVIYGGGTQQTAVRESTSWISDKRTFTITILYAELVGGGTGNAFLGNHTWGTPSVTNGVINSWYGTTYANTSLTYQLQSSSDGVTWSNAPGFTGASILISQTFKSFSQSGGSYTSVSHDMLKTEAGAISVTVTDTGAGSGNRYYRVTIQRSIALNASAVAQGTFSSATYSASSQYTINASNPLNPSGTTQVTTNTVVAMEPAKTEIGANGMQVYSADGGFSQFGSIAGNKVVTFPDTSTKNVPLTMQVIGNADVVGSLFTANLQILSDKRVKTNISPVENSLLKISNLNPVSFDWVNVITPYNAIKSSYGFIAQEVESILPDIVITQQNDIIKDLKNIDYNSITAINTSAIKELLDKIKDLEKRIEELEG